MKSLKTIIKGSPSPKPSARHPDPSSLPSSRSKHSSHTTFFKKYNQTNFPDATKHSIVNNKYHIVTEPVDDRMLQISKSYSKLSRSKRKEGKF